MIEKVFLSKELERQIEEQRREEEQQAQQARKAHANQKDSASKYHSSSQKSSSNSGKSASSKGATDGTKAASHVHDVTSYMQRYLDELGIDLDPSFLQELVRLELELHNAKKAKDDKAYKQKKQELKELYIKMVARNMQGEVTPAVRA